MTVKYVLSIKNRCNVPPPFTPCIIHMFRFKITFALSFTMGNAHRWGTFQNASLFWECPHPEVFPYAKRFGSIMELVPNFILAHLLAFIKFQFALEALKSYWFDKGETILTQLLVRITRWPLATCVVFYKLQYDNTFTIPTIIKLFSINVDFFQN